MVLDTDLSLVLGPKGWICRFLRRSIRYSCRGHYDNTINSHLWREDEALGWTIEVLSVKKRKVPATLSPIYQVCIISTVARNACFYLD